MSSSSSQKREPLNVQLPNILNKMRAIDFDLRIQALIDLHKDILRHLAQPLSSSTSSSLSASAAARRQAESYYTDDPTESQLVAAVLKLLKDENAEVKNNAVSCLAVMSRKPRTSHLTTIVVDLLEGIASADEERRDISCLALKSIILEMPTEGQQISQLTESVITKTFAVLNNKTAPDGQLASELLQILSDIYTRFPHVITSSNKLGTTSLDALIQILQTGRPALRKRAIPALSILVSKNPKLFDARLNEKIIQGLGEGGDTGRVWVGVVAGLARGASVAKVGGLIGEGKVVDVILEHTEDPEETDAVEGALVALEVLVSRCPSEISPHVEQISQKALKLVKYDPNYVELDDDDVDMDEDEEQDNDFEDDAYSDDEDVSWKIRRSAAKLIYALFGTRTELLIEYYKTVAPTLIARFGEREESVRLEILAAFQILLKQTATARAAELASGTRNKRKRSNEMDEDEEVDDSPSQYLRALLPQIVKATLKQLSSKSVATREQSFILLRQLTEALHGGLDSEASPICVAATSALRSVDSATTSSLAVAALSFLSLFFRYHSPRTYASHLGDLIPAIVRCMKDKLQRINFEAFTAASTFAQAIRPKGSASPLSVNFSKPLQQILAATVEILDDNSIDGEVRDRALDTLGNLFVNAGDTFAKSHSAALPLITARLANETTATTAIQVIGKIAESPACKDSAFDHWFLDVLPEIVVTLRRTRRTSGKTAEFACLQSVLTRVGGVLPVATADTLLAELTPFIDTPIAISTVSLILSQQPKSRSTVTDQLLPPIMELVKTPTVNNHMIDALSGFFGVYAQGDASDARGLVDKLIVNLGKSGALPDATKGGTAIYGTTGRCVGKIVESAPQAASAVLQGCKQTIKSTNASESEVYLALLCVGEIGRNIDLSSEGEMFEKVLSYFKNDSEEVRSAAAFAAGNLAVGSPKGFLPTIIRQVETAQSESGRVLLLHALKEVMLHSPPAQLESLADSLWKPLFAADTTATNGKTATKGSAGGDVGDDGVRNVKAACIGKLTTAAPGKFLPQLQEMLRSTPRNRAIVAAAVRYTFIDTSSTYDELISPLIVDFLSLIKDDNLIVRRLSLASLNAALQNKPHLIVDRLGSLQPLLYQETFVKPELQREVQMGPWKVIEDDGLENRKTAYETMYALLGTCFTKIDLPQFTDRVLSAMKDVNEIKVLGLMLLLRLGQLSPGSVIPRLDEVAESLKVIMKDVEVKEDTVKQDLERKEEMQKTTMRTAVPLYKMSTAGQAPGFHTFVGGLLAKPEWKEYRDYQA